MALDEDLAAVLVHHEEYACLVGFREDPEFRML